MKSIAEGSSPHSRGTLGSSLPDLGLRGIIPAFAGNTFHLSEQRLLCEDHPRIRGEHFVLFYILRTVQGSSPHSRGTLSHLFAIVFSSGIIPAFAGNTELNIEQLPQS